ncbi:MAG: hypothetical protein IJ009_03705 [Clostridia bacterium]|nr:hypothetical protein [Clostridia bacterium]
MQGSRKAVLIVSIIMALIGIPLMILGIIKGPSLVMIVLGVAFIFAAFLAYKSGKTYLDEQEQEKKNKK